MKGERIIAEVLSVLGMVVYVVFLQHLYAELLEHPERSWINQGKAWWVTRRSRARAVQLSKVWDSKEAAVEPDAS